MDIVTQILNNDLMMIVACVILGLLAFMIVKKVISVIITCAIVLCLFLGFQYYYEDITQNINFNIDNGVVYVKILDKEFDIDIDYIAYVEITEVEEGKEINIVSTKEGVEDITFNVSDIVYSIVIKPLLNSIDIEIKSVSSDTLFLCL